MPELRIETALEAERFVESIGFCSTLTNQGTDTRLAKPDQIEARNNFFFYAILKPGDG